MRRGAVLALAVSCLLAAHGARRAAAAAPPPSLPHRSSRALDHAVEAEVEGGLILLLSQEEVERRAEAARVRAAELAAKARALAPVARVETADDESDEPPSRRARAASRTRRRRPRGSLLYRQARVDGETYRQKYAAWSCSAASLTIALSLLDKKPANQKTEEMVIDKLGSNISRKDGLTGQGMDALANVARQDFSVAARRISSAEDVTREVQAGHKVVLDVRRRTTGGGHYVVVSGPGQRAGTVHVLDPAPDGGHFEFDRKTLNNVLKAGGVAVWNK